MSAGRAARQKEKSVTRVHIRWMIRRDMPEVMRTERASFEYAWTEDDFFGAFGNGTASGWLPRKTMSWQGS